MGVRDRHSASCLRGSGRGIASVVSILVGIGIIISVTLIAAGGVGYLQLTDKQAVEATSAQTSTESSAIGADAVSRITVPDRIEGELETGTIEGTITYGESVQNTTVRIVSVSHSDLNISELEQTRVRTDENGSFRFDRVPVGTVSLQVEDIRYKRVDRTVTVTDGATTSVDISLSLEVPEDDPVSVGGPDESASDDVPNSDTGGGADGDDSTTEDDSQDDPTGDGTDKGSRDTDDPDSDGGIDGDSDNDSSSSDDGSTESPDGDESDDGATESPDGDETDGGDTDDGNSTDGSGNGVTAVISATTTTPELGEEVILNATASSSTNGDLVSAKWNADPGDNAQVDPDREIKIERDEAINVTVTLTVEDETGANDTTTVEIAFQEPPPIVDNSAELLGTVTVNVRVEDQQGNPVEGETIKLEDRGGTPDNRFGETGPRGRLRFLENVGTPPCNTQTVKLVGREGKSANLGCNNGGAELSHTFTISE